MINLGLHGFSRQKEDSGWKQILLNTRNVPGGQLCIEMGKATVEALRSLPLETA